MQISHKEDYEKLWNEHKIDKSPVVKTMKGQVFMIEVVDQEHLPEAEAPQAEAAKIQKLDAPAENIIRQPVLKMDHEQLNHAKIAHHHLMYYNTEHPSLKLRQSSLLSEISQSMNANNLIDFIDKPEFNLATMKQDSFLFNNHRLMRHNSSFISNGYLSNNNSFVIVPEARYGGHMHDQRHFKIENDKFFEGVDEEAPPHHFNMAAFGHAHSEPGLHT